MILKHQTTELRAGFVAPAFQIAFGQLVAA